MIGRIISAIEEERAKRSAAALGKPKRPLEFADYAEAVGVNQGLALALKIIEGILADEDKEETDL